MPAQVLWICINVFVCEALPTVDQAITMGQIVAVIFENSGVAFPSTLNYLHTPLQVLLFDVNIVTPECFGFKYHVADGLVFQLMVLALFATCYALPFLALPARAALAGAGRESEIPNFKASHLGRFPLVSADFWTNDHLSERSRSVDAFSGTRARGTLMLKRT